MTERTYLGGIDPDSATSQNLHDTMAFVPDPKL